MSKNLNNSPKPQVVYSQGGGSFFDGLFVGAAIGAAGYFLFGTKKGQRIKFFLIEEAKDYYDRLEEIAKKEAPKIVKQAKQTKAVVEEKLPEIKKEINQELKELKTSAQAAKKQADQMEKKLQKTASRIEKKFFVRKGRKLGK